MLTETTHVNELKKGDEFILFDSVIATITEALIGGKGHLVLYGYSGITEFDKTQLGRLMDCNCSVEKVISRKSHEGGFAFAPSAHAGATWCGQPI